MVQSKVRECPQCKGLFYGDKCDNCGFERRRKVQRTPEERAADLALKEARKVERENKRALREAQRAERAARPKKTEAEQVRDYARMVMEKQRTRDHLNQGFEHHAKVGTLNKTIWKDDDFYVSVVFESQGQKMLFVDHLLNKFGVPDEAFEQIGNIRILNGLVLAKYMGLDLPKEVANDFPVANMELRNLILDYEKE